MRQWFTLVINVNFAIVDHLLNPVMGFLVARGLLLHRLILLSHLRHSLFCITEFLETNSMFLVSVGLTFLGFGHLSLGALSLQVKKSENRRMKNIPWNQS